VQSAEVDHLADMQQVGVARVDQPVGVRVDKDLPGRHDRIQGRLLALRPGTFEIIGITPRTLYRFMNEGQLAGYRFGRVIRLKATDIDEFIESSRISPGELDHLYPDTSASD
jgi:excisionase family DNA binding protein